MVGRLNIVIFDSLEKNLQNLKYNSVLNNSFRAGKKSKNPCTYVWKCLENEERNNVQKKSTIQLYSAAKVVGNKIILPILNANPPVPCLLDLVTIGRYV